MLSGTLMRSRIGALVAAGATVIATGRDERRLAALRERIAGPGRLVTEVLEELAGIVREREELSTHD